MVMSLEPPLREGPSPRQADAVRTAIDSLIDDFFEDVARLAEGDHFSDTTMAEFLPRKDLPRYTEGFAKRFLVCLITAAEKLTGPEPRRLTCLAEELALAS